ncbi:MAG: hypothetical protein JO345_18515 [Streptosporangiaceae bacterium]|nr:hypothetical protein [Streptosporangiaceae bacterium]
MMTATDHLGERHQGTFSALAAATAFPQALRPATQARACGVAQSGLYTVQGSASWPAARWPRR